MKDGRQSGENGSIVSSARVLESWGEVFARLELVFRIHGEDDHAQDRLVGVRGHRGSYLDWNEKEIALNNAEIVHLQGKGAERPSACQNGRFEAI